MALTNEAEQIAVALGEGIGELAAVTRGWPKSLATLPCAAVLLAGETPEDYRDNAEYLTELEYYVHIFCASMAACDRIGAAVDVLMQQMGYTRTFAYEDNGETCHLVRRFRKTG